jgi:hypothetical protein
MGHRPLSREADPNLQVDDLRRRIERLERRYEATGRFVGIVFPSDVAVEAGDDAGGWFLVIPEDLDGLRLTHAHAAVYTPGGALLVQIRNVTQAVDMLTTRISIDAGENTSYTAATQPVIDTANDEVSKGDIIVPDVDTASGEGLDVILMFT